MLFSNVFAINTMYSVSRVHCFQRKILERRVNQQQQTDLRLESTLLRLSFQKLGALDERLQRQIWDLLLGSLPLSGRFGFGGLQLSNRPVHGFVGGKTRFFRQGLESQLVLRFLKVFVDQLVFQGWLTFWVS